MSNHEYLDSGVKTFEAGFKEARNFFFKGKNPVLKVTQNREKILSILLAEETNFDRKEDDPPLISFHTY